MQSHQERKHSVSHFPSKHGGALSRGRRKSRRPLSRGGQVHLVLSSAKAVGPLIMSSSKFRMRIAKILQRQAQKFDIRIERFANFGSELHLVLKIDNRKGFQNFLRSGAALIGRLVTGARKGRPFGKFWDHLAFTQTVKTPVQLKELWKYLIGGLRNGSETVPKSSIWIWDSSA